MDTPMQVSQGRREISKARVRATGVAALTALALVALPGVAGADPEVLQSNDQLGLRFEKSSTPQPEGATTTVTVRTGDGKVVQTISEPFMAASAVPPLSCSTSIRTDATICWFRSTPA